MSWLHVGKALWVELAGVCEASAGGRQWVFLCVCVCVCEGGCVCCVHANFCVCRWVQMSG